MKKIKKYKNLKIKKCQKKYLSTKAFHIIPKKNYVKKKKLKNSKHKKKFYYFIKIVTSVPLHYDPSKYSTRPKLSPMEHFPYYDRPYDPDDSFSNIPKQWKKIKGGSLSRSKRKTNPIYDHIKRENVPGPGNYNPNLKLTRPISSSFNFGFKRNNNNISIMTGTSKFIGPGKYFSFFGDNVRSDWKKSPLYSVSRGSRKPLYGKVYTKNEMYFILPVFKSLTLGNFHFNKVNSRYLNTFHNGFSHKNNLFI